ncbi:MAG TPA: alpha/beta fold hydrolase [Dongiaceae bacterium]|nr:alpha/beta fold hydrolase [Dongiaceae bacterium]
MTTVNLGNMVAEVSGDGFPVVMVHGLGGTSNTFQPQIPALSHYRVIRLDLPGAGRSPVPHDDLTIEKFVAAVAGAAKALGVARGHFAGHSMGTLVVQKLAAAYPDLVASLTLFGGLVEPPEAARTGLAGRAKTARSDGMEPIAEQIIAATLSAETKASRPAATAFVRESLMRQPPEGYAKHCEALAKATAADHRLIAAPTLLLTGDADVVAPPSMAHTLGDRISKASVSILDRCGHWSTIEKPAECNERMLSFLQRVQ